MVQGLAAGGNAHNEEALLPLPAAVAVAEVPPPFAVTPPPLIAPPADDDDVILTPPLPPLPISTMEDDPDIADDAGRCDSPGGRRTQTAEEFESTEPCARRRPNRQRENSSVDGSVLEKPDVLLLLQSAFGGAEIVTAESLTVRQRERPGGADKPGGGEVRPGGPDKTDL